MKTSHRGWIWTAFAAGLVIGIPLGAVGLIVLLQVLTVIISP